MPNQQCQITEGNKQKKTIWQINETCRLVWQQLENKLDWKYVYEIHKVILQVERTV